MRRHRGFEPQLPKKVKIGWRDYKVVSLSHKEGEQLQRYGETRHLLREIRIQNENCSTRQTAHTLLHEILHVVCYMFNTLAEVRDEKEREEHIVTTLSDGLSQVLRDNPDVAHYLTWHHAHGS